MKFIARFSNEKIIPKYLFQIRPMRIFSNQFIAQK